MIKLIHARNSFHQKDLIYYRRNHFML